MHWDTYIREYKNSTLNGVVLVLALIIAVNIYKSQNKTIDLLREAKDNEVKKNEVLRNISVIDGKIKAHKDFFNKKDISLIMSNFNELAKNTNVSIVSVKPETELAFPVYVKYSYNLGISTKDYPAIGKFINKLESSEDFYVIDSIKIVPQSENTQDELNKGLVVNLKVSTFLAK